jgi:hypothetical protein
MVARYVIPEINGYVTKLRESEQYLQVNRAVFDRAGQAIMAKIMENKDAAEALKVTKATRASPRAAARCRRDRQEAGCGVIARGSQSRAFARDAALENPALLADRIDLGARRPDWAMLTTTNRRLAAHHHADEPRHAGIDAGGVAAVASPHTTMRPCAA